MTSRLVSSLSLVGQRSTSVSKLSPPIPRRVGLRCLCSVPATGPAVQETPSTPARKRIVSGVQPTGSIHLGNYLGAIKNWISLQNTYDTLFFTVDLHAITVSHDPLQLSKATRDTAALYLACGVDTSKASVFVQSHVRAHFELTWLLCSATPVGWLNKMIQFKEKSRKAGDENVGVALLTYPVLMASDILLYQSDFVPVGEDQKQHLELTRQLIIYMEEGNGRNWEVEEVLFSRFLSPLYHQLELESCFCLMVAPRCPSLLLLINLGSIRMTQVKDQYWYTHIFWINLLDPKDIIANKIKRCKTDSFPVLSPIFLDFLEFDNPERPECNNLLSVYQLISGKTKKEVARECLDMNWGTFKSILTDALVDHLNPIEVRYEEIISDAADLDKILAKGADKASAIADATLDNVYQAMGFLRR